MRSLIYMMNSLFFTLFLLGALFAAQAQSTPEIEPPNVELLPELDEQTQKIKNILNIDQFRIEPQLGPLSQGPVNFPDLRSLVFFPGQMNLLKDFERGFFDELPQQPKPQVRTVPEGQSLPRERETEVEQKQIPPTKSSPRELVLAGIAYNGPEKWTIWLNGQRITPQSIPEEIFKINVEENYVEFIWHDKQTHNIYPIRLRPNQRFNLDARMFLPG